MHGGAISESFEKTFPFGHFSISKNITETMGSNPEK